MKTKHGRIYLLPRMVSLCLFEEPIKGILRKKVYANPPLYSSPDINKKKVAYFFIASVITSNSNLPPPKSKQLN
jgi:hypothetical protein